MTSIATNVVSNGRQLSYRPTDLNNLFTAILADFTALFSGDLLLKAVTLAIGSDPTKISFTEILFQVDGMRYRIAAGDVAFTATTHDIADPDADPREAIYVLSVTAGSTTPVITKGTTAAEDAAVAPATPANSVKLGEVKIQHDGSAIFDATTDSLAASHLTVTYTGASATALSLTA